jgi:hypothetical protein
VVLFKCRTKRKGTGKEIDGICFSVVDAVDEVSGMVKLASWVLIEISFPRVSGIANIESPQLPLSANIFLINIDLYF